MFTLGRICPQCGYARQPDDVAPECECPRCAGRYGRSFSAGEVPSDLALVGGVALAASPATWDGALASGEEATADGLQPATLARRTLAALYTGSLALLVAVPLKLLITAAIRLTHPPGAVKTYADLTALRSLEHTYTFAVALVLLYAFFIRPLTEGASWGQERFGLTVRGAAGGDEAPPLQAHLLRLLGQIVALAAGPFTLAALLWGLATGQNPPGLADRLSGTRQYDSGAPPPLPRALYRACWPAGLALLLQLALVGPLSERLMDDYQVQALQRAVGNHARTHAAGAAQAWAGGLPGGPAPGYAAAPREAWLRQQSLGLLTNLERRHFNEQGRYTDDLEALVVAYGADLTQGERILQLVRQDHLRARLTDRGVELRVRLTSGAWRHVELHA